MIREYWSRISTDLLPRIAHTVLLLTLFMFSIPAMSHALGENYVWLNQETDHLSGRFELNFNDLESKLGLDIKSNGEPSLEKLKANAQKIQDYLRANFSVAEDGSPLELIFGELAIFNENSDFAQLHYRINHSLVNDTVQIKNTIFLTPEFVEQDRMHRSLIVVAYNRRNGKEFGEETPAVVFKPDEAEVSLNLAEPPTILRYTDFLWQGALHIWLGIDHVVFLVLLLVTAVLTYSQRDWQPASSIKSAAWNVFLLVTVFSIAHSLTFSLAALELVRANTTMVEIVIAISIVAVALNNIFPRFASHTLLLIGVFGLFHGLGFASAMSGLQFRSALIEQILVRFSLGVELGQLAIVAILFPIFFMLRNRSWYRAAIVVPMSIAGAIAGTYWVVERFGLI